MSVLTPKNLEIPPLAPLETVEDIKSWLKIFAETVAFFLRSSRSDTVEVASGDWNYIGGGTEGKDGSWRFGIDGNNLVVQHRESGSWVHRAAFEPAS